jgi:hypothetical protein
VSAANHDHISSIDAGVTMKRTLFTYTAAIAIAIGSITPAYAYPAGQAPTIGVLTADRLAPGSTISVLVSRVKTGCTVSVSWVGGLGISLVSGSADALGKTSLSIKSPKVAGTYTLSTSAISAECTGGAAATLTSKISVGKIATAATKIATTNTSLKKKPVVSVSGTIKSGSKAVASKAVSVQLNLAGKKVAVLAGKTDSKGAFIVKFSKVKYKAGSYTALVTTVADASYAAIKVTTSTVKLK